MEEIDQSIPYVILPEPLMSRIITYLEARPYREVVQILQLINSEVKQIDSITSIGENKNESNKS